MVHQERDLESEIQNAMDSATTLQERFTAAESQLQLSARAGDEPDAPSSPMASTTQSFTSPLLSPAQARARTVKMARQLESEHTEAEQRCEALQQQLKFLQSQLISKRDAYAAMVPSIASSEVDSELAVDNCALEPVISNLQSVEEARPVMAYLISQVALWKRRRIAADSDAEALRDRADVAQSNALDAQQRIGMLPRQFSLQFLKQSPIFFVSMHQIPSSWKPIVV
jgi:DNA repair exonuclease SbcCD ATPase subunit